MKIINEKGKLFGLINPIDLILIICAVVVLAAIAMKVISNGELNSANLVGNENVQEEEPEFPDSVMYAKLRVRGVMPYLEEEVMKLKPGENLVAGENFVEGAKFVSVESVPYVSTGANEKGEFVLATDENRSDLLITIKALQYTGAAGYEIATQSVRIGRGFVFKTREFELNTVVETIDIIKDDINYDEFLVEEINE